MFVAVENTWMTLCRDSKSQGSWVERGVWDAWVGDTEEADQFDVFAVWLEDSVNVGRQKNACSI